MYYSSRSQIEYERKRKAEKDAEQRNRFIHGLILAPILALGWFPVVWGIAKIFKL
jgi:hypothetical protein